MQEEHDAKRPDSTAPLTPQEIGAILEEHLHERDWRVSKPRDGWQKESFIAQRGERRVFVKFDVEPKPLKRLGELRVAPALLHGGLYKDRRFVIQQYVAGDYPSREWLQGQLDLVGAFVARYHHDEQLGNLLTPDLKSVGYESSIASEMTDLQRRVAEDGSSLPTTSPFRKIFEKFTAQASDLQGECLVPTHGDPNTKNFLVSGEDLFMIDWDELALADPMRDVGPFLWWYVPRAKWREFFESYGEPLDEKARDRICWWAARQSLHVALWSSHNVGKAGEVKQFLDDFAAAVARRENPHHL